MINPLNAVLNPICHLLALLGAHPILHISRIRVKHYTMQTSGSGGIAVNWMWLNGQCNVPSVVPQGREPVVPVR